MSEQKSKKNYKYWILKVLSIFISCALPIWAICEKFPVWARNHGAEYTVGAGGILILIVLLIIFRRTVINFIKDRMKIRHAPPLTVWIVMLVTAYILTYINKFIQDLTAVFWMGLIGCAIGTLLTLIAEKRYGRKDNDDGV